MPKFNYEAKKGPKELVKGVIEAQTQRAAMDKLSRAGYMPIRIAPVEAKISNHAPRVIKKTGRGRLFSKIGGRDLTVFTEQLASLLKAKVPILEAMNVLYEQAPNPNLKAVILNSIGQIRDGKTLSQSLSEHSKIFPDLYISMLESGESGGVLEETLLRLSDFRNKQEETKAKIISALVYPAFMVIAGIASVFVLLTFVIPRISFLFSEVGQALPLPTRILLSVSDVFKNYWYWGAIAVALAGFAFNKYRRGEKEKKALDKIKLKLPFIGDFIKKSLMIEFTRTFALLLANGISLFSALKMAIPTLDNEIIKAELELAHSSIINGASFEQSMKKSLWFPDFMVNMLVVGEKGGNLEEVLLGVASFYERETDRITKVITSLIEPAIILVMGLVIGFIVLAMLLPIFQINLGM